MRRFYAWRLGPRLVGWIGGFLTGALLAGVLGYALVGRSGSAAPETIEPAPTAAVRGFDRPSDEGGGLTVGPLVLLGSVLTLLGGSAVAIRAARHRRRTGRRARGARAWRLLVPPLSAARLQRAVTGTLWQLLSGGVRLAPPSATDLSERYAELLADNLGQPGFRELLIVAHDIDARTDVVFALLGPLYRDVFFRAVNAPAPGRAATAVDLAGAGRRHVLDALWGALALPVATPPHLTRFAPEGPWRGEAHRLGHRPEAILRLLQELQRAGVEQVIFVTAVGPVTGPHGLGTTRRDLRGALGELIASREAAAAQDAAAWAAGRLALFIVRPAYNPVGPLDVTGAYDERSDRWHPVEELIYRGYEDACRQFVDAVVAPSGERLGDRSEASASA